MSGFGTRICGICGKPCHELDDVCSDLCQEEADRRGEEELAHKDHVESTKHLSDLAFREGLI